jgi:hypothetical protein
VHLAVFAPAFTLSQGDSERSRKPPNAHSLGRYQTCKKTNKTDQHGHKLNVKKIFNLEEQ